MTNILDLDAILNTATVPEHSVHFMQAVSGGEPFVEDKYLCFAKDDWLSIIGYPLQGTLFDSAAFLQAKEKAVQKTKASTCFAIAPELPKELQGFIQEKDIFFTLDLTKHTVSSKLRREVAKAQEHLHIELGQHFSPEHRRLWTEFLGRAANPSTAPMTNMVQRLFLTAPDAIKHPKTDLHFLNAWDKDGHLAATLLLDFAPKDFCSYLLGAHTKKHYTPHAADALFAHMIALSREKDKKYIQLGLGVNEGITRFKRKWGGQEQLPFVLASWQEHTSSIKDDMHSLLRVFVPESIRTVKVTHEHTSSISIGAASEAADVLDMIGKSKRQIMAALPEQRPYAMLWQVQKGDKISWIGGSAHFFCYSFEHAFKKLFAKVDTVIFEGPLDAQALQEVSAEGIRLTKEQQPLLPYFTEEEICALERMVRGPEGKIAHILNMQAKRLVDVRWYLAHARPWTSLFTCWTGFLERKGWQQSVDLEAWHIAHDMGKNVVAMESLEEQLASLNAVPPERVVRYFQNCHQWPHMMRKNIKNYLNGDLYGLTGTSAEFPTRTRTIINERDERFRRRMRPFLEQGRTAVFVGTAHMLNLRHMLKEDGFTLTKVSPTWRHKLLNTYVIKDN